MTYTPRPLELSKVRLPASLDPLIEALSRHSHDVWAAERIKRGWMFGPTRDDTAKTNPCLVPYEDLPEQEKDMDRAMVLGILKAVAALGYEIRKGTGGTRGKTRAGAKPRESAPRKRGKARER